MACALSAVVPASVGGGGAIELAMAAAAKRLSPNARICALNLFMPRPDIPPVEPDN